MLQRICILCRMVRIDPIQLTLALTCPCPAFRGRSVAPAKSRRFLIRLSQPSRMLRRRRFPRLSVTVLYLSTMKASTSVVRSAAAQLPSRAAVRRGNHTSASPTSSAPLKKYRRTVFSGIQPTGIPHLGNYLGAIQNWIKLQEESHLSQDDAPRIFYSIVGLHAITMPQDPKKLRAEKRDALACLLACGLGPQAGDRKGKGRATLFFQEEVQEHAELAWYLNTMTSVGRLQRMTSWKSKLSIASGADDDASSLSERLRQEEQLKLGLLAYPVLQTADVLLYKSTDIPVGEDQQQHLELARDIAESFNHRFGNTFPLPRHMITPSKRVLSLIDPSQKMSKSAPNPSSRILITDPPETIAKRIRGAVTDSDRSITYDPENRRGVANLLTIMAACQGDADPRQLADNLSGLSGHAELKAMVAEAVVEKLRGIREEYLRLKEDVGYLREVAAQGRQEAQQVASRTMEEVRRKVGLSTL